MRHRFRMTLTVFLAGLSAVIALGPAEAHLASVTCASVSPSAVKTAIGAPVQTPNGSASTNSFDGYQASVLNCTYSSTLNISYSTPATAANWGKTETTLKRATAEKPVSGIGNGAFSGTGSNSVSTCNAKTGKCVQKSVVDNNLWFLVTGKAIVEISSTATLAREEALARKVVAGL
jgi:hypothetical protein